MWWLVCWLPGVMGLCYLAWMLPSVKVKVYLTPRVVTDTLSDTKYRLREWGLPHPTFIVEPSKYVVLMGMRGGPSAIKNVSVYLSVMRWREVWNVCKEIVRAC